MSKIKKRSGKGQKNFFFIVMVLAAGALFGCTLAIFVLMFITGGFIDPDSGDAINQSVAVTTLALLNTMHVGANCSAESSTASLIQSVNWHDYQGVANEMLLSRDFVANAITES